LLSKLSLVPPLEIANRFEDTGCNRNPYLLPREGIVKIQPKKKNVKRDKSDKEKKGS